MNQKAITGNPIKGKKHVIILSLINLVALILYFGAWTIRPDSIGRFSSIMTMFGLFGLSYTVLGFVLILLKVNLARVIMETVYLCVGIGAMILFVIIPITDLMKELTESHNMVLIFKAIVLLLGPFLLFSLLCLLDFAVLFSDKNIYAYTHSREIHDIDAETGKPKPLI